MKETKMSNQKKERNQSIIILISILMMGKKRTHYVLFRGEKTA